LSTRNKNKLTTELHGILKRAKRVWRLPPNPAEEVELLRKRPRVDFEVYSPEEVLPSSASQPPSRTPRSS
jgi:hypothetical protein